MKTEDEKRVLAWDTDFTKLMPVERVALEQAEKEIDHGEYISHDEINWD